MEASGEVLEELIKAKENIKRKYIALKHGKADVHSIVTETFKPIIEPLNEIQHSTLNRNIQVSKNEIEDIHFF